MLLLHVPLALALAAAPAPFALATASAADPSTSAAPLEIAWLPARVGRHSAQIQAAAARHGVDPQLVAIVILLESSGRPDAQSPTGALGLMQVMPATAARLAAERGRKAPSRDQLLRIETNLDYGVYLLAQLQKELADPSLDAEGVHLVAAAYNGGIEQALAHVAGAPLSAETSAYAARVRDFWLARDAATSD